jgi:hypothetical protein
MAISKTVGALKELKKQLLTLFDKNFSNFLFLKHSKKKKPKRAWCLPKVKWLSTKKITWDRAA